MSVRIRSEQKSGNVDLLLSVIFGENMRTYQKKSSFSKEAVFPELIRSDFPLGMNLSRIKRGEPVSDTILRKTLILLNFYYFFAVLFAKNDTSDLFCAIESDFLDFVHETNDLLCSSGLPASLWQYVVMFGMIAAGCGLVARGLLKSRD